MSDEERSAAGLSVYQLKILDDLMRNGPSTIPAISRRISVSPKIDCINVTSAVIWLCTLGYVVRVKTGSIQEKVSFRAKAPFDQVVTTQVMAIWKLMGRSDDAEGRKKNFITPLLKFIFEILLGAKVEKLVICLIDILDSIQMEKLKEKLNS